MRDAALWFAIYMVWASAAVTAWPIYGLSALRGWLGIGGGPARFALDVSRFVRWMIGGEMAHSLYSPGQKLRFGITLTLGSTSVIALIYWQLERGSWSLFALALNAFVVGLSYAGIMVHLYVAWREKPNRWRAMVWAQAALFALAYACFDDLGFGATL